MKLVQKEAESGALRRYLRRHRAGATAVDKARRQLARLHQVRVDTALLDAAAVLAPGMFVRSLDAIHLAAAQLVAADLRAVVTYDQ